VEPINQDDVIQILRMIEGSTVDELSLEMGDLKLIVKRKSGKTKSIQELDHTPEESTDTGLLEKPAAVKNQDIDTTMCAHPEEKDYLDKKGLIPIKAPMLGTFYRSPKPGAPPFVEVGQLVAPDDTVCIIEVMKLFNTVKAGMRGRIAKIFPKDAQMVEFQQTLFLVEEVAYEEESAEQRG